MRRSGQIVIGLLLFFYSIGTAMAQKRNTLTIAEDHLILQIDLQSPKHQVDSLLKVAGISGADINKILAGDFTAIKNDGWNATERQGSVVRFERSLADMNENPQDKPYLITTRIPSIDGKPGIPKPVQYGVNKFARITVSELASGLTRFFLPGYLQAKRVFLSGSFNNWSTLKGLMTKTDGGWMIDIALEPGAYEYKYIIGGRWTTDPNNLQQTGDGAGNVNSVYYKYNYIFRLPGNALAHRVMLVGTFNNWDAHELVMRKTSNAWELPMYLNDGKHLYRFMIDGKWITDPKNPAAEKADDGILSSVLNLGTTVDLSLAGYANANEVILTGDFYNGKAVRLKKEANNWATRLTLERGNYSYNFNVDGSRITDPTNPHTLIEHGEKKSFLAVRPNHTFILKGYGSAKNVTLHGSFNKWEPAGYTMARKGDDWIIKFYLKPGKYLYKFVVDGRWILDPGNKLWEQNEFDTGNSVLWME